MEEKFQNSDFTKLLEIQERKVKLEKSDLDFKQKLQQINSETTNAFNIIEKILEDQDALFLIRYNTFIKTLTYDLLANFIKSSKCEIIIKRGLCLFQQILQLEYDEKEDMFYDYVSVPLYGSMLLKIMPQMSEIAIEESFFTENEAPSDFQETLLRLVFFTIKTVQLKTLFHIGFKPKHLQFIIINFPQSPVLPKITLALSENLRNLDRPKLYELESQETNEEIEYDLHQCLKKVYALTVKTFDLFFKLFKDNWNFINGKMRVISKIYFNLAEYARANYNPLKIKSESNIFLKNTKRMLKFFKKKLYDESTKKSKNYNYICFIIQIIEYHFDNLNYESQKDISNQIIFSLKNVLSSIFQSGKTKDFKQPALNARARCFSLILKILENLKEDFIKDHLKSLEAIWSTGIKTNSKIAIKAFVALLRFKNNDLKTFIQKVMQNMNRTIEKDIDNVRTYSKPVIAIVDYFATNKQSNLEVDLMSLVESIRQNYMILLKSNVDCILPYVDFIFKIFKAGYRTNTTTNKSWQGHIESTLALFHDLTTFRYNFNICLKTYLICLDIIEFFTRIFRSNELMFKNGETIFEMLIQIESKLKQEDWDKYAIYESELNEMFEVIQELKWI